MQPGRQGDDAAGAGPGNDQMLGAQDLVARRHGVPRETELAGEQAFGGKLRPERKPTVADGLLHGIGQPSRERSVADAPVAEQLGEP